MMITWVAVSAGVHATRAAVCLVRTHHNYHSMGQLLHGVTVNVASSVLFMVGRCRLTLSDPL